MGMVFVSLDKCGAKMHRNMAFDGDILINWCCIGSRYFWGMEGRILVACGPVISRTIVIPSHCHILPFGINSSGDGIVGIPFIKTTPLAWIQIVLSCYLWRVFNPIFNTIEVMAIPEIHQVIKGLTCDFGSWPTSRWINVIALVEQDLGIDPRLFIGF